LSQMSAHEHSQVGAPILQMQRRFGLFGFFTGQRLPRWASCD